MFEMNHFKSIDELVKFFPTEQSCTSNPQLRA